MPGTRAQSRGKAAGGGSSTSDGNLPADQAAVDPGVVSADDIEMSDQQGNMSDVCRKDLQDA